MDRARSWGFTPGLDAQGEGGAPKNLSGYNVLSKEIFSNEASGKRASERWELTYEGRGGKFGKIVHSRGMWQGLGSPILERVTCWSSD